MTLSQSGRASGIPRSGPATRRAASPRLLVLREPIEYYGASTDGGRSKSIASSCRISGGSFSWMIDQTIS